MEEILNIIREEYPKTGLLGITKRLHIGMPKLKRIIKENNLILCKRINMDDFYHINKKEVSYFLGLLWSDGYISKNNNSIGIESVSEDIKNMKSILNNIGKWSYHERMKNNCKPITNLTICDKYLHEFFVENDYLEKSLKSPTKIVSKIPEKLISYFLLGIIDGDGCFYYKKETYTRQLIISGTHEQDWSIFEKIFNKIGIKNYRIEKYKKEKSEYSQIRITNYKDIVLLGNYIYSTIEEDFIGLERKYLKFCEIKNSLHLKTKYKITYDNGGIYLTDELSEFCKNNEIKNSLIYYYIKSGKKYKNFIIEKI